MAFSSNLVKEWYNDLSVEELEKKYQALEEDFYFDTKEKQIEYTLKHFMYSSHNTNLNATRTGLEELLKEKTGKDYHLKTNRFELKMNDVLDYILKSTNLISKKDRFVEFFNSIDKIEDEEIGEEEKIWFLMCLYQSKKIFKEFVKELKKTKDNTQTFAKYCEICEEYYSDNHYIG